MTLRLGLVGHPVGHSRSPDLFAWLSARTGVASDYRLFDVPDGAFAAFLSGEGRALDGFNVTAPHKQAAYAVCAEWTPPAARTGAVNAVRRRADGALVGTNTDVDGFAAALGTHRPRVALLLGAGGAARAVLDVLLRESAATVLLASRDQDRAETARDLRPAPERARCEVLPARLAGRRLASGGVDLIVQATSTTVLEPAFGALPFAACPPGARAIDLVYRPPRTPFLVAAAAAGVETVNGFEMLAGQAVCGFAFFQRQPPPAPERVAADTHTLAARLRAGVD